MKKILCLAAFCFVFLEINTANASPLYFEGNLTNYNDIVTINFSLINDAHNLTLWTDSYEHGANFDPLITLWNRTTGEWIDANDDNDTLAPSQTEWDSGMFFASFAAGDYFLTLTRSPYYAQGLNISEGFALLFSTPSDEATSFSNEGTYWRVNLDGVDAANISAVPAPAAVWLIGSGLLGLWGFNRKPLRREI
jgi:hypothetical protein